jgi:uncharacterized membrane protein
MSRLTIGRSGRGFALALLAASLAACEVSAPAPENETANEAAAESAAPVETPAAAPGASNGTAEAPAADPAPAPDAPKAAAPKAWSASGYRLVGTEPFWGGTVAPTRIVYSTPENQAGEPVNVDAAYGAAREIYSGTLAGNPFVLTLTKGPCSDGMSDKVHKFTAALQVRGETRQGCADPQ